MKIRCQALVCMYLFSSCLRAGLVVESVRKSDFGYAAFVRFPNSKLNVNNSSTIFVEGPKLCAVKCALNLTCLSFNLGTQPVVNGQTIGYACELIPTKFHSSLSLETNSNLDFHHYIIQSSVI